jgi:hypothetical protein
MRALCVDPKYASLIASNSESARVPWLYGLRRAVGASRHAK